MAEHGDDQFDLECEEESYWQITRRPLQILAFLLPLIIAYEIGLGLLLTSEHGVLTNKAHEAILRLLEALGVTAVHSLFMGGLAIVVVLLIWHVLARDPWHIDGKALGMMAVEAVVLTIPLLAIAVLVQRVLAAMAPGSAAMTLSELDMAARLSISVGAGLYEELLFRMLIIAIVHTIVVDAARAHERVGIVTAIVVSAIAFTVYHPLHDATGALSPQRIVFYFLAGIYFGVIYVGRGFGLVVAVHALYDVVTVALLPAADSG